MPTVFISILQSDAYPWYNFLRKHILVPGPSTSKEAQYPTQRCASDYRELYRESLIPTLIFITEGISSKNWNLTPTARCISNRDYFTMQSILKYSLFLGIYHKKFI